MASDNIQNLLKIGTLVPVARNPAEVQQLFKVASDALTDAKNTTNFAHTRYMTAYEGIHSLANAILLHNGTRPGNEKGHRVVTIQTMAGQLNLDAGTFKIINDAHNRRNQTTYHSSIPAITDRDADTVTQVLEQILPKAKTYLGL